jgi:hypothetical protein
MFRTASLALLAVLPIAGCGGDIDSPYLVVTKPGVQELVGTWAVDPALTLNRSTPSYPHLTLQIRADGSVTARSTNAASFAEPGTTAETWTVDGRWTLSQQYDGPWSVSMTGISSCSNLDCVRRSGRLLLRHIEGDPDYPDVAVYFVRNPATP